jgi:acyl-CoA thioester hydrolase
MGHVNHAVFLTYLEQARFAYWRALHGEADRGVGPGAGTSAGPYVKSSGSDARLSGSDGRPSESHARPSGPDARRSGPDAGIIIARAEVDFRAPILMGDPIEVRLWVSAIGRTSFTLDYEIVRRPEDRVVASARTVIVAYDYTAGHSIPIPDDMRARLDAGRLQSVNP